MTSLTAERAGAVQRSSIGEEDIRRFQEDGAVCLRGVIPMAWIERMRTATDRALALTTEVHNASGEGGRFVEELNLWPHDEEFQAYVFEGPTWKIAQTLMGARELRLFGDQLFVKEPGTPTRTPWHHDQTYWPVVGDDVCTVWVPLDPVNRENGGLEYIRGSHRWGRRFNPQNFGDFDLEVLRDAQNEKMPDIDAEREKYTFLSWEMEPGDALVHNSLTVHGSGGNLSQLRRRRAITTRWFGDRSFFRPTKIFPAEMIGLKPGDKMNSPYFPHVPRVEGEPVLDVLKVWKDSKGK